MPILFVNRLSYGELLDLDMQQNIQQIMNAMPTLFKGSLLTMELTAIAVVFGLLFGLFLALGRLSRNKILNSICWVYIWLLRGTPLLLQLYFIYYALPLINPALTLAQRPAAYIALSLNSAAYLAEIIRAAIQSIDKGQMEACKALGMSYGQAMSRVIIPQSYRRLIPPVGNEFIMLLKDSSLVSIIALQELLRETTQILSRTGNAMIFIPCAILYLAMTTVFTVVFEKLEKKYSIYE